MTSVALAVSIWNDYGFVTSIVAVITAQIHKPYFIHVQLCAQKHRPDLVHHAF